MVVGEAKVATAILYTMGEMGLLSDGEYFVISVDMTEPYDERGPAIHTRRKC